MATVTSLHVIEQIHNKYICLKKKKATSIEIKNKGIWIDHEIKGLKSGLFFFYEFFNR